MSWAKWDCLQCKSQRSQSWFCSNKFAPCAAPSSAVHTAPAAPSGVRLLTPGCPRGGLYWAEEEREGARLFVYTLILGLPWRLSCLQCGRPGLIPGSGRSPGGGHGNPLQDSCLENPMDRGAWQATVHGVIKSQKQLSD